LGVDATVEPNRQQMASFCARALSIMTCMDLSHLDKKYFIDQDVYNCPYCKRNNVPYALSFHIEFDWTDTKPCHAYFVVCKSCEKESLHLAWEDIRYEGGSGRRSDYFQPGLDIDSKLFYHRPTSSFILDNRIPREVRDLFFEAEQCRQANHLVGASACIRKSIYALLAHEDVLVPNEKTGHTDYASSIAALKTRHTAIDSGYFDALSGIQELTSNLLHEDSWEAWDSPKLQVLSALLKEVLTEIYVIPEERKKALGVVSRFKAAFSQDKPSS